MKKQQSRRIKAAKLRQLLIELADVICNVQDKVTLSLTGNTFEIHLDGGSVNITLNKEGGER